MKGVIGRARIGGGYTQKTQAITIGAIRAMAADNDAAADGGASTGVCAREGVCIGNGDRAAGGGGLADAASWIAGGGGLAMAASWIAIACRSQASMKSLEARAWSRSADTLSSTDRAHMSAPSMRNAASKKSEVRLAS